MQPDDFEFLASWNPPAHMPGNAGFQLVGDPQLLLPNIHRLKNGGVTMDRAYTASPMCGTSRYSTMTGRYPSRSSYSRRVNGGNVSTNSSRVVIGTTKLMDVWSVEDGNDCSESNLAVLLRRNGYATGVVGKWHLGRGALHDLPYQQQQDQIRSCGFETAEAIYWENLFYADGTFLHNLEHVTDEALRFIDRSMANEQDFFLYFNPTAPHYSGSVYDSLTEYSCQDTPGGRLEREPSIRGMTAGIGCEAYRRSILQRARGDTSNPVLGSIWVDDAVGALISHLESYQQLENTFFLFQMDHGQEGKSSLYEPGIRIAQFVHYPQGIPPGKVHNGLVSTIDIAPTIAEYAGITVNSRGWYPMDGMSWRSAVQFGTTYDRCLVAEMDRDRTVVCTCAKQLVIGDVNNSRTARRSDRFGMELSGSFILCNSRQIYYSSPLTSTEVASAVVDPTSYQRMATILRCHEFMTRSSATPVYGMCDRFTGPPRRVRTFRQRVRVP